MEQNEWGVDRYTKGCEKAIQGVVSKYAEWETGFPDSVLVRD